MFSPQYATGLPVPAPPLIAIRGACVSAGHGNMSQHLSFQINAQWQIRSSGFGSRLRMLAVPRFIIQSHEFRSSDFRYHRSLQLVPRLPTLQCSYVATRRSWFRSFYDPCAPASVEACICSCVMMHCSLHHLLQAPLQMCAA